MAEHNQLLTGKALAQLLGEIDPVGDQSFQRDTGRTVLRERLPRAALVPLDPLYTIYTATSALARRPASLALFTSSARFENTLAPSVRVRSRSSRNGVTSRPRTP
jgi:hypothetical protein